MITLFDTLIDRITMYRLTLYVLLGLLGIAAVLSYVRLLPFSPLALIASTAFLVLMCWAANTVLARIFGVPTNIESAAITALILALILDPAKTASDFQLLGWAAVLAMASKYVLALYDKHIFNPAAIAVVITAFTIHETASWWVGTASMLLPVLLGAVLLIRKTRQEALIFTFLVAAVLATCVASVLGGTSIVADLRQLLVESPLFFFASVMLTEPRTAPPTRGLKCVYGVLTGALFIPQVHAGSLYSTPELALVAGNVFAFLVSPKHQVALTLKRKKRLSPDIVDFVFTPSQPLAFAPGQYLECTLAHPHPDARGNRRYFTLASSPTERVVHLGVRFYPKSSTFKRAMVAMNGRAPLWGGQVAGDFTLPHDPRQKLVFIAGGIGITPYRSMLKYLVDTKQRRDIVLLYASRTAQDIVYGDVLDEAQERLGVKVVYTLTDTAQVPRNWPGAMGRITAPMIARAVPDWNERTYYVSGPPDMVKATERVLRDMHIARRRIKTDFFPGLA